MKKNSLILCVLVSMFYCSYAQKPVSHPEMLWELKPDYSDEFNSGSLDYKWDNNVKDWGTWSWEPENAYVKNNALVLQMQQKQHVRNGKTYYFTSGIAQIAKTITYGYFEARIKASDKGQGTCPAFWMYSVGGPDPTEEGGVKYCEIDAVEIFQVPNQYQHLEMNLHTRILENGVLTWKRPGQGDTELCHNSWDAPWDPRDEYHTYGVMNRPDSVFWYVDGVERGRKKNYYWHLPMHITVSMGLRTPYEKYINGVRTPMEYPEVNPEPGFPAEMYCDYVRVWEALPQIIVDKQKYQTTEFDINEDLKFECYYDAGSGYKVSGDEWGGMKVKLVEKNSAGEVVNEVSATDVTIVGNSGGKSVVNIPLTGLKLTENLPAGNYYSIVPVFKSSKDGGIDVYCKDEIRDVKLVEKDVSIADEIAMKDLMIFPNPANDFITIKGISAPKYEVSIFDVNGVKRYDKKETGTSQTKVAINDWVRGVYFIKVKTGNATKNIKFCKN